MIVCLLLLAGWGLAAMSLHVIRTPDDIPISLVPKENFGLRDTYVDTTKWTIDDVGHHPMLVTKLIRTGKSDLLKHLVPDKSADVPSQLGDALQRGQREERSKSTQPASAASSIWKSLLGWL